MSRPAGWYWVKQDNPYGAPSWEPAYFSDGWSISTPWCVGKAFIAPVEVGPRIPTPDEPWHCVPKEPNAAMSTAGGAAVRIETTAINKLWTAGKVWQAMLKAAPSPGQEK